MNNYYVRPELFLNLHSNQYFNMEKKLFIAKPIAEELSQFETIFTDSITSSNERIQAILDYMMKSDGKKIRPTLIILAAKSNGEVNRVTYDSAIALELLHTASLIHDDVVDESKLRRGLPSLNAVYDNKIAVLAGDYCLSTAMIKVILTGNFDIISIISAVGRRLAEGELNQLSLVREFIISEDEYYNVIKYKTASLMSACMQIGAISTNASKERVEVFGKLGEAIGMIFQMRDDIFDYYEGPIGKPTGNDIREGKITLPLLHALNVSIDSEKKEYLDIIEAKDFNDANIHKLIQFAISKGGVDYTFSKIDEYKEEAFSYISTINEIEIRDTLYDVVNYIINRDY